MERYTHGHHGSIVAAHARRTAEDSARFLLGHLHPSVDLLDVGCGPGSISVDLAGRVRSVTGIDASHDAIRHAGGGSVVGNARFAVGSAYRLPMADGRFDIVYAHQLLQHLGRPVNALVEMRRVLRPGGLVAVRDADYGTMVHDPHDPRLDRWLELYRQVARRHGGQPDAGRRLAGWVVAAGFTDLQVTSSTWVFATPEGARGWADLWISRLLEARFGRSLLEMGLADEAQIRDLAEAWHQWAASPAPFFAFLHGEVVARA